jgi:putative addiction module killer protein
MQPKTRTVRALVLDNGRCPFEDWLESIREATFIRAVYARLTRVRDGNFGDHKSVGQGVFELRIPTGPGLRVYYGLDGTEVVILLGGGDKSTQSKDIREAQALWRNYKK